MYFTVLRCKDIFASVKEDCKQEIERYPILSLMNIQINYHNNIGVI